MMRPARIADPRAWADRYQAAEQGLPRSSGFDGRTALHAEVLALFSELVGAVAGVELVPEDIERPELLKLVTAARLAIGGQTPPEPARMVPLRELTDLARVVLEMRRLQREFFEKKRQHPFGDHRDAYQHARRVEDRAEAAARSALNRERESLPGMEEFSG